MNTIRIALLGAAGRMGRILSQKIQLDSDLSLIARVDQNTDTLSPNIIHNLEDAPEFDVLIDFSQPAATAAAVPEMAKRHAAWIAATTGLSDDLRTQILDLQHSAPIFIASNTSLGIAVMQRLCRETAAILQDWDAEIIEMHHRSKVDAPSGTALSLADAIAQGMHAQDTKPAIVTNRTDRRACRPQNEIGIASIRGGTAAGEHRALWLGNHEQLEIKHTAESREIFAVGAIRIAKWIAHRPAGAYDMNDMLNDLLGK